MFQNKTEFIEEYKKLFMLELGRDFEDCNRQERYKMLVKLIASEARTVRLESEKQSIEEGKKKVYYFSMEFLLGRLLENYLMNFGVTDIVRDGLSDLGVDLEEL